jgi:hypothetical protein
MTCLEQTVNKGLRSVTYFKWCKPHVVGAGRDQPQIAQQRRLHLAEQAGGSRFVTALGRSQDAPNAAPLFRPVSARLAGRRSPDHDWPAHSVLAHGQPRR